MISVKNNARRAVLQYLVTAVAYILLVPTAALAASGGIDAEDVKPPPAAPQENVGVAPGTGGVLPGTGSGVKPSAKIVNGRIELPVGAPQYAVNLANAASTIAAAKPGYRLGGGHNPKQLDSFLKLGTVNSVYDCSGYAGTTLVAAGLHKSVLPSGGYMRWGKSYRRSDKNTAWVHVYAHAGHMMVQIGSTKKGVFIDTSNRAYGLSGKGPIITERKRKRLRGFRHRVPNKRVLARAARAARKAASQTG